MMAAIAIPNTEPTEMKNPVFRALAPKTGGVRHPCIFCNSRGYSTIEKKEQQELLSLMSETERLRQENYRREKKLRKLDIEMKKVSQMNLEMEDFFTQLPLGKDLPIEVELSVVDEEIPNTEAAGGKVHFSLEEKEMKLQFQVIHQQLKLITDVVTKRPLVSKNLWGHKSRTWPRSSKWKPHPKPSTRSPKPFSIPFCPKPIHLLARKAYLKPPPKLPPLSSYSTRTPELPMQCSSVECNKTVDDMQSRELFADALERAVNSGHADHPYYDHDAVDQGVDDLVTPWADHPYYDDLTYTDDKGDEDLATPWADHPYYDHDDLEISGAGQGDELDVPGNDDSLDDVPEMQEEPAWEDHPFYDHLDEGEDTNESDAHDEDQEADCPDATSDDATEEVPWEEHPYYDEGETNHESTASDESIAWSDHSSYNTEEDEVAWEDSPFY